MTPRREPYEVAVIGAGQAGLAVGYFLASQGRSFVILDAGNEIGSTWRDRWASLTLFTPRRYDGLPGAHLSLETPTATRREARSSHICGPTRPSSRSRWSWAARRVR
jgi:cation diffusion facilitator CzcD-associated flavoprotein CzcO